MALARYPLKRAVIFHGFQQVLRGSALAGHIVLFTKANQIILKNPLRSLSKTYLNANKKDNNAYTEKVPYALRVEEKEEIKTRQTSAQITFTNKSHLIEQQ